MNALRSWLAERAPIAEIVEFLRHKSVPQHRYSLFYYAGGAALFFFIVQVITGALLLMYYRPSASEAYESVQFIMARVPFGWLVRSIHAWSANLMIGAVFVHLFSVLFLKSYRRPRELTWMSGVLLMGLVLMFGFTGYLLPWNQLAYFATRVGTDIPSAIPWIGLPLVHLLRGGPDVTGGTLTRFFGVHVAILPGIATMLLAAHLLLVQRHGMSVPPSIEERAAASGRPVRALPFLPHYVLHDLFGWTIALGLLAALSAFFPWGLGKKADLFAPAPAGIRPEWYFLWAFETLKLVPAKVFGLVGEFVAVVGFALGGAVLFFLPILDRDTRLSRRIVSWMAAAVVLYMLAMTLVVLRGGGS
jgi:quinol-cytochrome oxidoreductase complex cytochrome b subunit